MQPGAPNSPEQISKEAFDSYQEHKDIVEAQDELSGLNERTHDLMNKAQNLGLDGSAQRLDENLKTQEEAKEEFDLKYEENLDLHKSRKENLHILKRIAKEEMKEELWTRDLKELSHLEKDIISKVREEDVDEVARLMEEYEEKVSNKQEKMYKEHKKENTDVTELDKKILKAEKKRDSFKKRDLDEYDKMQEEIRKLLDERTKLVDEIDETQDNKRAEEFSKEYLDTLQAVAKREMEAEINTNQQEETNTQQEETTQEATTTTPETQDTNENQVQNRENEEELEREEQQELDERTKRRMKVLGIIVGVIGATFGGSQSFGFTSATGGIGIPIVLLASWGLYKYGKTGNIPFFGGRIDRGISEVAAQVAQMSDLPDNDPRKREKIEELNRRKNYKRELGHYSSMFFKGAAAGALIGGGVGTLNAMSTSSPGMIDTILNWEPTY